MPKELYVSAHIQTKADMHPISLTIEQIGGRKGGLRGGWQVGG